MPKNLVGSQKVSNFASQLRKTIAYHAKIAQLVEHDLAKVGVAGSSPVFRSKLLASLSASADTTCPGGGIGRHATLRG